MRRTYSGGCHCGDVRFAVELDLEESGVVECNCSMCAKKGYLHAMVPQRQFRLLSDAATITTYTFNTHTAKHTFCARCGIHSFYTPRSHPDHIDVNVRCLDGVDVSALSIDRFDGQNWEANVASLRQKDLAP
jgi:hypothetical protein